jgi:hypothetical protein
MYRQTHDDAWHMMYMCVIYMMHDTQESGDACMYVYMDVCVCMHLNVDVSCMCVCIHGCGCV